MNFIRNFFVPKNAKPIILGRWAPGNEKIKSVFASSDHCGDSICGNPKKIVEIMKSDDKKKPKNINSVRKLHTLEQNEMNCIMADMSLHQDNKKL